MEIHQQAPNSLCSSIHASQYSSAFPTPIGLQLHSLALPGFHRRDHGLTYKISCGSLSTSNNECSDHPLHLLEVFMSAKCSATAYIQKSCPGKHVRVLSPYQWKRSWKDPRMGYKHPAAQILGADTRCIHQLLLKGYEDNTSGLDNKSPCKLQHCSISWAMQRRFFKSHSGPPSPHHSSAPHTSFTVLLLLNELAQPNNSQRWQIPELSANV